MARILRKSIIPLVALTAIMGFLFYAAAGFFLQDQFVTNKVSSLLQKKFQGTGLQIKIGKVHWFGINQITATKVTLKDLRNVSIPFEAERIYLKFNLLSLIINRSHPEASLQEIELLKPRIQLQRLQDGSWNFSNYFPRSQKKLQLQALFKTRGGIIDFQDYLYGRYILQEVDGQIKINKYSLLTWNFQGISDFNARMQWTSKGRCRIDRMAGMGEFSARHLAVNKLASFIPRTDAYRIKSGFADAELKLAWNRTGAWLENGSASITDAVFFIPQIKDSFVIKHLDAHFSPIQCKIDKAYLIHNRAIIKATGMVNNKTAAIKAELSAEQADLEDLDRLFPVSTKASLQGTADLRLALSGTIDQPIIDGEIFVNTAQLMVAGKKTVEQISGRLTIRKNNLKIERLEGSWNNSLLGVYGNIYNLFNPRLDLKIYGFGLSMQPDEIAGLSEKGLKTDGEINFIGEISGRPSNPKVLGEVSFERISYQEVPLSNLKLKLEWDGITQNLRVLEVRGDLWEGHLTAKGEVRVNRDGIQWQLSGDISGLNLNKIASRAGHDVNGKVNADLILKGNWRKGTPFQAGSVLGIFRGENLAYKDTLIDEANGVFSWVDGNLSIDSIQVKVGSGIIYGHLFWNPAEFAVNVNAENIRIQSFLPTNTKYPLDGVFNGSFSFTGPLDKLTGKIDGVFTDVTWADKSIGTITGSLEYGGESLNISRVLVATDTGDYALSGRVDLTEGPKLSLQITSDNTRLNGFLKWLPVTSALKLDGTAKIKGTIEGPLANPAFQGEVSLKSPAFGPLQMDQGFMKVRGNFQELVIDEFDLFKQDSQIAITGKINAERLDLKVNGSSLQLETMGLVYGGKTLYGTVDLRGEIAGALSDPILTAQINGKELIFGDFYFQQLTAAVVWNSQMLAINSAQLSQDQTVISLNGKIGMSKPLPLNLDLKISSLGLNDVLSNITQMPAGFEADGKLSGFVKITGDLNNPKIQTTGSLSQGIINTLPVTGEFEFSYENHQLIIKRVLLNQGMGTLLADGVWEAGQLVKIEAGLQDFPCQVVNPFIKSKYKLDGVANAFLLMEWTSAGVSGEYRLAVNGLQLNEYRLGDLHVNGSLSDQGIAISNGLLSYKGGYSTVEGYIPWSPELLKGFKLPVATDAISRNLSLDLNLRNTPAEWVNTFIPGITVSNGLLDGQLKLAGNNMQELETIGRIDVNDLKADIAGLPDTVEGFQATIAFDGSRATLKKAKGGYGNGKFNISGYFEYRGLKITDLALDFTGSDIYYNNHYFDGYGDLKLKLTGPLTQSSVTGEIIVNNSRITIATFGEDKKPQSAVWNPDLLVTIRTGKNVRYRQMGLANVTLKGKIQAQGKMSDLRLEGEVVSPEGMLTFYGQTFTINHGKATFKYSQGYLPYIDVNSSAKTPQAEVFLTAKGQVGNDIAVNLTAQPYMSQSEILALLKWPQFNETEKPITVSDIVTGNISFVTDSIFGDIFYEIRSALDVDYLYLEPNYQQNDLRINVGRNITKDFFLSYSRSFSDDPNDIWGLNYQISPYLSLKGSYSLFDGTFWRLLYHFSF